MKFKYIEFGGSLIKGLDKDPFVVYVFSDYILKNMRKVESERNIFEPDPLYLTFDEFKDRIYQSDRVVLNEAKRFISLYNLMKKEFKNLEVNSYFESMEFSDSFFKYYNEVNKSLLNGKKIQLEKWQEKYFKNFEEFKEKYQKYLDEKKYIPKDWVECVENLDLESFKKFKKIVFIDIVDFSPLDKFVLKELEKILEVEIILQMPKEFFDEENLELKEVFLPQKQEIQISKMEVQDEYELAGNLIDIMTDRNYTTSIFSPESDTNNYFKFLPNNFVREGLFKLNDTKFYKMLEIQSKMIDSIDGRVENLIPVANFIEGINRYEIRDYYGVKKEDIEELYNLVDNGYKYIGNEKNETLKKIYDDIIRISKFTTIDEFIEYFNHLVSMEFFQETAYLDFYDKIQEYMGLAKTTEIMLEESEMRSCFKNGGEILKFLLLYLNGVELKRNDDKEGKYIVKALEKCKVTPATTAVFINLSNLNYPKIKNNLTFLTEKQKKENGFTHFERERKIEKYRFYQALLKNKENIIIYIKNEKSGENLSPFLTEVLNNYEIEEWVKKVKSVDMLEKLEEYLDKSFERVELNENSFEKNVTDFEDNRLNVSPYNFNILVGCEYRYYLEKIKNLSPLEKEIKFGVDLRFLGKYIHGVVEKVTDKMWKQILNISDYNVNKEELWDMLMDHFYYNRKKVPIYLDNYFIEVLIPRFYKNVLDFYKELEKLYIEKKVTRIESEKSSNIVEPFIDGEVKVFLNGRVDLIVETPHSKEVIDFKTGSKEDNQLDFYTIMLYGDETQADKTIYNVFDGKFERQKKTILTKEELKESLIQFLTSKSYELGEKKKVCGTCSFGEICRREM